jgi:general secretion pathway protein D
MRACPSRKAWGEMLWELNQPDPDGLPRFTILIRDQEDLVRLRRAVLLKKVVGLNGGEEMMTLANFSLGKVLLIPEPKPNQTYPIDATVARYFYYTEHYYGATLNEMEQSFRAIEEMTE